MIGTQREDYYNSACLRFTKAREQYGDFSVQINNSDTQQLLILRMLSNIISYMDVVLVSLHNSISQDSVEEFEKTLRLFWRQISLFDTTVISLLKILKPSEDLDHISLIIQDLEKRAELAEEAQNRMYNLPPKQTDAKFQRLIITMRPFMEAIVNVKKLESKHKEFAQKWLEKF